MSGLWGLEDPMIPILRRWLGVDNPDVDRASIVESCTRYMAIIEQIIDSGQAAGTGYVPNGWIPYIPQATGAAVGALCAAMYAWSSQSTNIANSGYTVLSASVGYLGMAGLTRLRKHLWSFKLAMELEIRGMNNLEMNIIASLSRVPDEAERRHIHFYTNLHERYGSEKSLPFLFYLNIVSGNFVEAVKILKTMREKKIELYANETAWNILIERQAPFTLLREYLHITGFKPKTKAFLDDEGLITCLIRDIAWLRSLKDSDPIIHAFHASGHLREVSHYSSLFTAKPRVRSDMPGDITETHINELRTMVIEAFDNPSHPLHQRCQDALKEEQDKIEQERQRQAKITVTIGGLKAFSEILEALNLELTDAEKKQIYTEEFKPALDKLITTNDNDVTIIGKKSLLLQNINAVAAKQKGLSKEELTQEIFLEMMQEAAGIAPKLSPRG